VVKFKFVIGLYPIIFSQMLNAGSVSYSYSVPSQPARDLIYNGKILDADSAVDLQKKGIDLSTLEPATNDVYGGQPNSLTNEDEQGYPQASIPVLDYDSLFPAPSSLNNDENAGHYLLFWARVLHNGQAFRLSASFGMHGALMRNALLRKLGYNLPSPKFYPRVVVRAQSKAAAREFLEGLSDQILSSRCRFVVEVSGKSLSPEECKNFVKDPGEHLEFTLQDVSLEPARINVPTFHWGIMSANYLEDRRSIRALVVPFTWLDVHESINLYKWEVGSVSNDAAALFYPYAQQFSEASIDDARWIVKKIARLTRDDLVEIVKVGKWPADIEALLIEKVVARRNHLLQLFNVNGPSLPYDSTISVGNVKNGKLMTGNYPGYSQRFIWGDPQSPLTPDELGRFGFMMGISAGISQAVSEVNKHLGILGMEELQKKRLEGLQKNFIEAFKKNPYAPYHQPVSTWGGFIANGGIEASRNLVTGTYYGTDQSTLKKTPLQLVDLVGVRANVGYFLGIDGINKNVFPGITAGVGFQRSYVHVRPVTSVQAAMKEDWGDIFVPEFMRSLGALIKLDTIYSGGDINVTITPEQIKERDKKMDTALNDFLNKFKSGEVFTITDTLTADAAANVRIPLYAFMPVALTEFDPTINISGGLGGLILRRTTITRTEDGVHVYVQNLNSVSEKLGIDLRFWIKFAELTTQAKQGYINTKAYLIDSDFYDHKGEPKIEDPAERKKFANALSALLRRNSTEKIEEGYSPYVLKHELDAVINSWKFLIYQRTALSENHLLRAFPPKPDDNSYDPADYERDLFASRNTEYIGRRFLPTISDVIGRAFERDVGIYDNPGPNPAFSFFGTSKMQELKTDAEITGNVLQKPVTATIHSWQGWYLSRDKLLRIIDDLNDQIRIVNIGIPGIRRDMFMSSENIEFYDIRTTLLVYEKGIQHLIDTLVESAKKPPIVLPDQKRMRAFADDFTPTDPQVIEAMADLWGRDEYNKYCAYMGKEHLNKVNSVFIEAYHQGYKHKCISDWMSDILSLRRKFPSDPKKQIQWINKVMAVVQNNVELGSFMKWIGKKNLFFQVKVSGFRKNDELGDKDYISDSVGNFDDEAGAGVFKDFVMKYKILSNEVEAKYFGEGF
jgi:hypothetical protein